MFQSGQKVGAYTLIKRLGRGGFGEVWLAERYGKFATTRVAVKLPLDEQVDHAAIEQEAQLWAKASGHPNVLPIIEADEYDGQIVIVSEYAPDGSLEDWLKTRGRMPVEQAVKTTIQILDGLEFLHSKKIIHRDLKPANILLQGTTPRLADFGIARAMRTTLASQSQNISGTFAYMSPEALDGRRSVQTDIWSVGVNLYQFLTGALPFPQKEPSVLLTSIMLREFEPLPEFVPYQLKEIIAKCLEKLPENRYRFVIEIRKDLDLFLRKDINLSVSQIREQSLKESISIPLFPYIKTNFPETSSETKTVISPKNSGSIKEPATTKSNNISSPPAISTLPRDNTKFLPLPPKIAATIQPRSRIREAFGIFYLAIAVLLFLTLISYNPNDPSFNTASSQKTQNWVGPIGANIAEFLVTVLGSTAYFSPAFFALTAWRFFHQTKWTFTIRRFIGYLFFIATLAACSAFFNFHGGIVGVFIERMLVNLLGTIGTSILLGLFFTISLLLIVNPTLSAFVTDLRTKS